MQIIRSKTLHEFDYQVAVSMTLNLVKLGMRYCQGERANQDCDCDAIHCFLPFVARCNGYANLAVGNVNETSDQRRVTLDVALPCVVP